MKRVPAGVGANAARFARADAYARPGRSRTALGLTIGLHLLAAWLWLQGRPLHPPRPEEAPGVITILVDPADPASASTSTPQQPPRSTPASSDADDPMPAVRPRSLPPVYVPPPDATSAPPSSTLPSATPAPAAAPAVPQAPAAEASATPQSSPSQGAAAPASANGSFTASLGQRQAGRIDRELRGGKSGVPTEADTPWSRFQRGLEAANVDRSMSARLDSYTSPDGVVIYRRRVGGRIACYRTGSVPGGVDSSLGALGVRGANDAGSIPCPSSADWKREE